MAFSGTPFMFDAPQQPKDTSSKAEPLATEKTLRGMRDGQSIIQGDLFAINSKLGEKGAIYGALVDIADILDSSAIARHSNSPLETSLAKLQESSVSYNEKTMRWHDDQTNLMVKGTDPRVAEAMKISEKPRTVEAEIHWGATIAGFLSDIKDDTATLIKLQKSTRKLIGRGFFGKKKESVEEGMEGNIADKNATKNETKQTGFLKGISDHFKKRKEESGIWKWFKDNWGKLALGLFVALAPMKWFPKIWEFLKDTVWPILNDLFTWGTENPMKALGTMLIAWFAGPAGLAMLGGMIVGKLGGLATGLAGTISKYAMPQGGPGLGPRVAGGLGTKVMGGASLLAGVALAIKDGMAGAKLSEEWGVGKASGVAGAVLGGTDKGISGAFKNAGKWALIGAGIGSFVPVIGTMIGGLVGAGVGAIAGFFGGAAIAGWIDSIASTIKEWFFSVIGFFKESLMQTWEGIKDIWENGLSWERVWNLVKANPLFRLSDIIAEGLGNLWKSIKSKFSRIPGFGPDEAEASEGDGDIPKGQVTATATAPKTSDERSKSKSNISKLQELQKGEMWGTDSETEKYIDEMDVGELRNAVQVARVSGIDKSDKALYAYMVEALKKRTMSADDKEDTIMTKNEWTASDEFKKTFLNPETNKIEGASTAVQEMEYTNYVEGKRGTAGVDLSGPDEMDIMEKELERKAAVAGSDKSGKTETLVHGKKTTISGLNITSKMEDKWAEHRGIEQRGKKRVKRRKANLDLMKQMNRGHSAKIREVLGDKLYTQMTKDSNIGGKVSQADMKGKRGAVKIPPRSIFKTKIPTATGLMPNEEGWDDDDDDLIKQDDIARKKLGKPFGKIKYQTSGAEKLVPSNPNQQGATLTAGQQQTANLSGGSAGGNVGINTTTVNNTTLGESTMVVGQQRPVGNPKMVNLT